LQLCILLIVSSLRTVPLDLSKTEFEQVGQRVLWSRHEEKPLDHLKRGDWYLCLRGRVLRIPVRDSKPLENWKRGVWHVWRFTSWTVNRVNLKKRLFLHYS